MKAKTEHHKDRRNKMRFTGFYATLCASLICLSAFGQDAPVNVNIPHLKEPPKIDGVLDEWSGYQPIAMSRPNVDDLRVEKACLGWDKDNIYLAVSVSDKKVVNSNPYEKLQLGDSVDFRIAKDHGSKAFRIILAPSSNLYNSKPAFAMHKPDGSLITSPGKNDESGIRWAVAVNTEASNWSVEAAIPAKLLGIEPKLDATAPFVITVWDRDDPDKDEWKQWWKRSESSNQKAQVSAWPLMVMAEDVPLQKETEAAKEAQQPAQGTAKSKKISLSVPRHKPCNIFDATKPVKLDLSIKSGFSGKGELKMDVTNFFGKTVKSETIPVELPLKDSMPLPLDNLGKGYFEVNLSLKAENDKGETAEGSDKICLGVADITHRTAEEVRKGNYRFGMKMSYLTKAWWHGNAEWDEREVTTALCELGMQWTRVLMQQTSELGTVEMLKDFPMNAIIKVERFPKELYDEETYGPMKEWEVKYGKGAWVLKTLPKKKEYQAWLKSELDKIPANQNVFEIWNEAWDKMSPEDLAKVSQWIAEIILKDRPDAIIGPNLIGSTSKYDYDSKYIDAGGMKGMKMVALHPYAGSENRQWMRDYKKWLRERLGHDVDIYVTEYGSHSTPKGPAKRSEREQAQRVVRQSLALYAEGVAAFTPHWVGQREQNPTYHEDWFGFIRLNHEPKPALIAHAVSGRMIDTSRYVGDLWFGPGVGAMLFERNGIYTLALWTQEGSKDIKLDAGVDQVTVVDMEGAEKVVKTEGGSLPLTASQDVLYIVGLSPTLEKVATTELNPDRWPKPEKPKRVSRTITSFAKAPVMDGDLKEWDGMFQIAMMNPKVNGDDASGMTSLSWDEKNLYIAVEMRDNEVLNKKSRAKLYQHDSIELFVSTEPRDVNPGYGPNDYQFF
ncbi:MAG: hypothetical protein JXR97_13290, partial [Planctomycetes bacterium]|nr:hypothetical protein [Planctomycetota bacterium]